MEEHNTDVTAYGSDSCAIVKGERVVVLQKNEVVIRRVLCESRYRRRGGLKMGWYALVRNVNLLRMKWRDFTLSLLRIMHHRVKEVKLQSFSIRLYAALLTTRKTSQSSLSNSPVLCVILGGLSTLEGSSKRQQR